MTVDLRSVAGKKFEISGHAAVLVVGAGAAGLAAAIEAARNGRQVTLVDENPVPFETMGGECSSLFRQPYERRRTKPERDDGGDV